MSNYVQCPNCGGYRIICERTITEKPNPEYRFSWWALVLSKIDFVVGFFTTFGFHLLFLLSRDIRAILVGKQRNPLKVIGYHYACQLCGYRWIWNTGTPLPKVRVNHDLITRGAQRLEEEAEEERKRQEALYHLSKLGKK